ncbi:hypothetical protein HPP92_016959 [Vanilla planifolia]|uniref:Uncharacterized protein n=1 Tax=Vanilla planifolia TaxID=51239 RepID=A0A835QPQ6_VANPL|nr:hypothetical protein HPP92_016959 [Vanilla planifolia]
MSNFDGEMIEMYFSEHSFGTWMVVSEMEFEEGKPVAYASLNGHAFYSKEGLVLRGSDELGIGIRNDAAKGKARMDAGEVRGCGGGVLAGGGGGGAGVVGVSEEWGPKVEYKVDKELQKLERLLPKNLVKALRKLVDRLPAEVLGEEGPTGPKLKSSWDGDEP